MARLAAAPRRGGGRTRLLPLLANLRLVGLNPLTWLAGSPTRTTPYVSCDINDGLGSTFHGPIGKTSRIDFWEGPATNMDGTLHCGVPKTSTQNSAHPRLHLPLVPIIKQSTSIPIGVFKQYNFPWHRDLIMKAWQDHTSEQRSLFINKVETELEVSRETFDELIHKGTPDVIWSKLNIAVRSVTTEPFSRTSDPDNQTLLVLKQERKHALTERANDKSEVMASIEADLIPFEMQPVSIQQRIFSADQRLKSVTKHLKTLERRIALCKVVQLSEDIADACGARHLSDCWRLARLLARTNRGPKNHRYGMPVSLRPTADEYEAFFSLPGPEGGIAAQRIQWQFEYDDVQQYAIEPPMPDMNMIHRRKGVPDKSVPSELWALLCFPNHSKTGLVTKGGIGQDTEKMRTNDFHRLKRGLHIQIRRCAATPMVWHRAKCVGLQKHNNNEGLYGKRHINVLDPFGGAYHKGLIRKKVDRPGGISMMHGCIKGRRREGAIMAKSVLQRGEHRAIPTEAVRKLWRLPWHCDELRARRLLWYQSMSRDPGASKLWTWPRSCASLR